MNQDEKSYGGTSYVASAGKCMQLSVAGSDRYRDCGGKGGWQNRPIEEDQYTPSQYSSWYLKGSWYMYDFISFIFQFWKAN
jgi:hypothetical protein